MQRALTPTQLAVLAALCAVALAVGTTLENLTLVVCAGAGLITLALGASVPMFNAFVEQARHGARGPQEIVAPPTTADAPSAPAEQPIPGDDARYDPDRPDWTIPLMVALGAVVSFLTLPGAVALRATGILALLGAFAPTDAEPIERLALLLLGIQLTIVSALMAS